MVSTLAMADANGKLLIAKGVFTDDEFKAQSGDERADYIAVPERVRKLTTLVCKLRATKSVWLGFGGS
jgi:photosystem II stability/assembly factor-like uncharacterized protein